MSECKHCWHEIMTSKKINFSEIVGEKHGNKLYYDQEIKFTACCWCGEYR